MNIDAQAIREFREVYLVSNTPLYLFKRLRQLPAVQQLAEAADGKQLIAEYFKRSKAEKRTAEDVATAYACLVAITLKGPNEAIPLLRSLGPTDLDWSLVIRDLYLVKVPAESTQSITITNPPLPVVGFATDATENTAYTDKPKPTIEEKANI